MRKKVMIITETCMDGVGKHVSDLVRHLNKEKYEIMVLHGTKRVDYYFEDMKKDMMDFVEFVEIPSFTRSILPSKELRSLLEVNRYMRNFKPEIVHCHSSKAGVIGRFLALQKGYINSIFYTPHAYAIQNMDLSSSRHWLFLDIERSLGKSRKVMTINVSNGENFFAKHHGILGRSCVIYNAVDDIEEPNESRLRNIKVELGIAYDEVIVTCIARLYYQKNPSLFLDIAENAKKLLHANIRFLWIGEGEMFEKMKQEARRRDLDDTILFLGHRKDVGALLSISDVYLSTAIYEGLPYTLIEACRAGVPIVASDIVGNNEVVSAGVNGLLYKLNEDRTIDCAVNQLKCIIEDQAYKVTMGRRSREIYENRFTIKSMIEAIEQLYDTE